MNTADERTDLDITIRPLSLADIDSILEIEKTAFTTPWREVTFRNLLTNRDADLIGAILDSMLIGYAIAWTIGDQAELGNVAVAEAHRRRGVGHLLVTEALQLIRQRGALEVFLEVRETNRSAQRLYDQSGFQVISRRKKYYNRPVEDALVMRCDLS